jgi:hypothetical protein
MTRTILLATVAMAAGLSVSAMAADDGRGVSGAEAPVSARSVAAAQGADTGRLILAAEQENSDNDSDGGANEDGANVQDHGDQGESEANSGSSAQDGGDQDADGGANEDGPNVHDEGDQGENEGEGQ